MKTLSLDIETFSDVNLNKTGVYAYACSPNFEIASYESYEALGANGVIDDLMAELNALPNFKEDVTDDKEVD